MKRSIHLDNLSETPRRGGFGTLTAESPSGETSAETIHEKNTPWRLKSLLSPQKARTSLPYKRSPQMITFLEL